MGLVKNVTDHGLTKSIFRVSNEAEQKAYQALINQDMAVCPRCYSKMTMKADDMLFEVANPLTQTIGMDLATFTPICPNCRGKLSLPTEIDLNPAFPTAVATLKRARDNYAALKAKQNAAKGNKGGTNGKR